MNYFNTNFKSELKEGFFNSDCPKCGSEDAYFNGISWECPNCNYTWGGIK